MIEDKAKTKLCPILAIAVIPTVFSLELKEARDKLTEEMRCQASDCMMWRWSNQEFDRETELWSKSKNCRVTSAWGDDAEWRPAGKDAEKDAPPATGYCGLAGK